MSEEIDKILGDKLNLGHRTESAINREGLYSNGDYKKLRKRIRESPNNISESDLDMLQYLRSTYKDDLSIIFNQLINIAKKHDKKAIITYRIKRIESIISKIMRQPTMQVYNMADIAGCRCIVANDDVVWSVYHSIMESGLVYVGENDYITTTKDDGYRSMHIMVKVDEKSPRTLEIQIRSRDEHNWATLVEITDFIFKSKIKERGEGEMAKFHKLLSKDIDKLSICEKKEIIDIAKSNNYFNKISSIFANNYLEVRDIFNNAKTNRAKYFLLATGDNKKPEITPFARFNEAEDEYYSQYKNNKYNKNIVLTHINNGTFEDVSMAYSNYFLTYNALFFKCYALLSSIVIDAYDNSKWFEFTKRYRMFLDFTLHLLSIQIKDLYAFNRKKMDIKTLTKRTSWLASIKSHVKDIQEIFNQTHHQINGNQPVLDIIKNVNYFLFRIRLIKQSKD